LQIGTGRAAAGVPKRKPRREPSQQALDGANNTMITNLFRPITLAVIAPSPNPNVFLAEFFVSELMLIMKSVNLIQINIPIFILVDKIHFGSKEVSDFFDNVHSLLVC
jgi:hypothetical protein